MSMSIIVAGLAAALAVVSVLLAAMFGRALSRQRRNLGDLTLELEAVRREMSALCTGALGAGGHLERIDRQMLRLVERQNRLEEREVADHDYERAAKLIRAGAGVERIVKECGLPRAEVELLLRMHVTAARAREAQGVSGIRASGVPM
ncbi:MAG: DUF2802 domain-containing protein [Gammaproteobacteria bacterium]|jgi:hypothetical protein|nr:DUF2802 domain-containing protein [Gammaproteobacteria bacterium]